MTILLYGFIFLTLGAAGLVLVGMIAQAWLECFEARDWRGVAAFTWLILFLVAIVLLAVLGG